MPVSGKPRLDWRRRTSGRDPDASRTAPSEDFACEPCQPPFEQQPQYKAPTKGASTFLQSRVVQLRGVLSTSALSPMHSVRELITSAKPTSQELSIASSSSQHPDRGQPYIH